MICKPRKRGQSGKQIDDELATVAFLLVAWDATAPVEVPFGFETGNNYLQLSEPSRRAYAMGLFDALMAQQRSEVIWESSSGSKAVWAI
jgi:hypothetical protein